MVAQALLGLGTAPKPRIPGVKAEPGAGGVQGPVQGKPRGRPAQTRVQAPPHPWRHPEGAAAAKVVPCAAEHSFPLGATPGDPLVAAGGAQSPSTVSRGPTPELPEPARKPHSPESQPRKPAAKAQPQAPARERLEQGPTAQPVARAARMNAAAVGGVPRAEAPARGSRKAVPGGSGRISADTGRAALTVHPRLDALEREAAVPGVLGPGGTGERGSKRKRDSLVQPLGGLGHSARQNLALPSG